MNWLFKEEPANYSFDAFVKDTSPNTYENLVDHLLASRSHSYAFEVAPDRNSPRQPELFCFRDSGLAVPSSFDGSGLPR